jgi:hypothetical protein
LLSAAPDDGGGGGHLFSKHNHLCPSGEMKKLSGGGEKDDTSMDEK